MCLFGAKLAKMRSDFVNHLSYIFEFDLWSLMSQGSEINSSVNILYVTTSNYDGIVVDRRCIR
jgi:hypothetical protein